MNGGKAKIATILKITIEIGTVLIALMALLFSIRPQLLPWNNNHFERANAGDVESQMFLADHYFEIGDYKEAIYWYKLASAIKGEYQAKACNNLGYIYAMGWGLSENELDLSSRLSKAYQSFKKASNLGLENGTKNAIMILRSNSAEDFPGIDYVNALSELSPGVYSEVVKSEYVSFNTYTGREFWDGNTKYTYSGCNVIGSSSAYTYYAQTFQENIEIPKYIYEHLH